MMMNKFDPQAYIKEVNEAAKYISNHISKEKKEFWPKVVLTLGSGLSDLAELIDAFLVIPYQDIPYFPQPTVAGHKGEMIIGYLNNVPVIGLSGRKHFYEVAHQLAGIKEVVFPVHVMANLGAKMYFATNAVGGLNLKFKVGDLMMIKSHRSFGLPNPLAGPHLNFGENVRFQPQTEKFIYQPELRELLWLAAMDVGESKHIHEGFYAVVSGPTYESKAESLELRDLGYSAVGMSVVPEVIVAANRGLQTIGVSIITNLIDKHGDNATSHDEVKAILSTSPVRNRLTKIFSRFFEFYESH